MAQSVWYILIYTVLLLPCVFNSTFQDRCRDANAVLEDENVIVDLSCNGTHISGGWDFESYTSDRDTFVLGLWYECHGPAINKSDQLILGNNEQSFSRTEIQNLTSFSMCFTLGCILDRSEANLGLRLLPTATCDIDECEHGTDNCNQICTNTDGSFECNCINIGFELDTDDATCMDINECEIGTHNCHANASCNNTEGSFNCTCNAGYSGDGVNCMNIDECVLDFHNCDDNANCTDTIGSFFCTCRNGFQGDGVNCTDIDECEHGTDNCNQICTNTDGSFECNCINIGFELDTDDATCMDIDECEIGTHNCHANASCNNTEGSFNCTCNAGYSGDGVNCMNIDECVPDFHNCHMNAECTDTQGSFNCTCHPGFDGDGVNCTTTYPFEMALLMPLVLSSLLFTAAVIVFLLVCCCLCLTRRRNLKWWSPEDKKFNPDFQPDVDFSTPMLESVSYVSIFNNLFIYNKPTHQEQSKDSNAESKTLSVGTGEQLQRTEYVHEDNRTKVNTSGVDSGYVQNGTSYPASSGRFSLNNDSEALSDISNGDQIPSLAQHLKLDPSSNLIVDSDRHSLVEDLAAYITQSPSHPLQSEVPLQNSATLHSKTGDSSGPLVSPRFDLDYSFEEDRDHFPEAISADSTNSYILRTEGSDYIVALSDGEHEQEDEPTRTQYGGASLPRAQSGYIALDESSRTRQWSGQLPHFALPDEIENTGQILHQSGMPE